MEEGETLAVLYASEDELFQDAASVFADAVDIQEEPPAQQPLILARVEGNEVCRFEENSVK